eukprot:jgi/Ulvmu1/3644/UM017_0058.1
MLDDIAGNVKPSGPPKGGKWRKAAAERQEHCSFIYCIKVCPFNAVADVCATVGGAEVNVVRVRKDAGRMHTLGRWSVQAKGPDGRQNESLYSCEWILLSDEKLYVLAAGLTGTIYLVRSEDCKCTRVLQGHGNPVNALQVHPCHEDLLLSASADESIRLWNVATGLPLAVFSGERGHASEILSLAWSLSNPNLFASAGMDCAVKIWTLQEALDVAPTAGAAEDIVQHIQEPVFSSTDVHQTYVDDVAWAGDLLLTKSVHDEIVLWRPVADLARAARLGVTATPVAEWQELHRFKLAKAGLWYVRMGLDAALTTLACGNTVGKVHVWRLRWDAVEAAPPGARRRVATAAEVVDTGLGEVPIRCVEVVAPGVLLVGMDSGHVVLLVQRAQSAIKP